MHGLPPKKGISHIGSGDRFVPPPRIFSADNNISRLFRHTQISGADVSSMPTPLPGAHPAPKSPVEDAHDISKPLTREHAQAKASALLGHLVQSQLLPAPDAVSATSSGSRFGFNALLHKVSFALRTHPLTVGAIPERDRRGGMTSSFVAVNVPIDPNAPFPAPVFLALNDYLGSLHLFSAPFHYHLTREGNPVHSPFAEPWANALLREINAR